jgi:hypothetical protein
MTSKADILREAPRDLVCGVLIVAEAMRAFVHGVYKVVRFLVGMVIVWGMIGLLLFLALAAVVGIATAPPPSDMHVIIFMLWVIAIILAFKP